MEIPIHFQSCIPIGDKKCIDFKENKVRIYLNIRRTAALPNYYINVNTGKLL